MSRTYTGYLDRFRGAAPLWVGALAAVALFLFAIQLLGTATEGLGGTVEEFFRRYVAGDAAALGVSWLGTYALTNGSVVAALSVSLFKSGFVTDTQLFLMVAGSRLGGAGIVVLIGAVDYFQKHRYSLGKATSLGLLTFLLTYSVYIPAAALGYLLLPRMRSLVRGAGNSFELTWQPLDLLEPVSNAVVDLVGVLPGIVIAVLALFVSLTIFDRVLESVETEWLRQQFFTRFRRKWTSLALGFLVTAVTTSVAFSLGVIVPLYNRGYVKRREIVPYVLGANIGTFLDTVVIAILLETPEGVSVVLALVTLAALITLVFMLLLFRQYLEVVDGLQNRVVEDRRYLAAFLTSLVVLPLVIAVLPL